MFKCVIVSMFKNESWIMKEWIEHYIREGVEHFYLIDNGSTDLYTSILEPYKKIITLVVDPYRQPLGTQNVLLNKYFLKVVKEEAEWVIVVDMDEYMYSRRGYARIVDWLNSVPTHIGQILVPWKCFGSNGHIQQPASIINSLLLMENGSAFCTRSRKSPLGHAKTITRTVDMTMLETHAPACTSNRVFSDISVFNGTFNNYTLESQYIHCNHYTHMSRDYYTHIKVKRGGGQGGVYTNIKFEEEELLFNVVIDTELRDKYIPKT